MVGWWLVNAIRNRLIMLVSFERHIDICRGMDVCLDDDQNTQQVGSFGLYPLIIPIPTKK